MNLPYFLVIIFKQVRMDGELNFLTTLEAVVVVVEEVEDVLVVLI